MAWYALIFLVATIVVLSDDETARLAFSDDDESPRQVTGHSPTPSIRQ